MPHSAADGVAHSVSGSMPHGVADGVGERERLRLFPEGSGMWKRRESVSETDSFVQPLESGLDLLFVRIVQGIDTAELLFSGVAEFPEMVLHISAAFRQEIEIVALLWTEDKLTSEAAEKESELRCLELVDVPETVCDIALKHIRM